MHTLLSCALHDRVNSKNGYSIPRNNFIYKESVYKKLHMPWHFSVRNRIRRFLKFENLEIVALHLIRHNEIWIHWTIGATGLLCVTPAKSLQLSYCVTRVLHCKYFEFQCTSYYIECVSHLRGNAYPSSPGLMDMLGMTVRQDLH